MRGGKVAKVCVCGLPAGLRVYISAAVAFAYLLYLGSSFGQDFVEYVADVRF